MTKVLLVIALLVLAQDAFCQTVRNKSCYQERSVDSVKIFTRTLHYPHYKGKEQALNLFLLTEVDLRAISESIPDTVNIFADSVKVKFVISRDALMSNISALGNNLVLVAEIKKALIKSACNWVPGGTEMYLPVWFNGTIHFKLERLRKFSSVMFSVVSNNP